MFLPLYYFTFYCKIKFNILSLHFAAILTFIHDGVIKGSLKCLIIHICVIKCTQKNKEKSNMHKKNMMNLLTHL